MAKKKASPSKSSTAENLGGILFSKVIDCVPTVIDAAVQAITTPKNPEKAVSPKTPEKPRVETKPAPAAPKRSPYAVWEAIGCSTKTAMFIEMSLADGVIDTQERALITKRASAEGVDLEEFEFLVAKKLEANELINKNAVKELSRLFSEATKMTEKEVKPDTSTLSQALPKVMTMAAKSNAGVAVATEVLSIIASFIKEPSKLNEFKAEIIRMIEIPMLPSVIVEFFAYANSQIIQERQKVNGKGYVSVVSETLFGKELELEPIWKEKMSHVMGKVVARYGNDPVVMASLKPYRITPLKKFMAIKGNRDLVLTFPVPKLAPDFIELMRYAYRLSQDKGEPLAATYYDLCRKMHTDGRELARRFPAVAAVIQECRNSPLVTLKANINDEDYLIMFNLPDDVNDAVEVLQFTSSKPQLKNLHKRIYRQAEEKFQRNPELLERIKTFRPKGLFGL